MKRLSMFFGLLLLVGFVRGNALADNPYLGIDYCAGSEDLGTISGGDKGFKALSTVKLTAKADKGYVFAGWFYDEEGTEPAEGDTDYRATSFQFTIGYDDLDLYAKFLPPSEDYCGDITIEDEGSVPQGLIGVASGSLPTVTVTGLPAGLTFDKKTGELVFNEKKMKDGAYAFTISAKNTSGYKNDRVVTFVYGEAEELETRYAFTVGQTVAQPVSGNVTGLPAGLKCVKATVSGETTYTISGTPTKVGRFTAKETLPDKTSEAYYILIDGAPSKYIAVSDDDLPPGCKATGSGVVSAGGKATLKATAAKGYVFAGWYADPDFSEPVVSEVDYRNPSLTITDVSTAYDTYYPRFVLLQEDSIGEIWLEAEGGVPQGVIVVESASLPTITVTGLPTGLAFDKKTNALVLDESKLKPGDYAFVISAKNAGGFKNDRVVTFQYECKSSYEDWGPDYALGQIVWEDCSQYVPPEIEEVLDVSMKGLPTGLSLIKEGDYYCLTGTPTKPGRYTVTCYFEGWGYDGESKVEVKTKATYYMIIQGAPSRYIEVKVDDDAPDGCKVTGTGVCAAGATVKTSATAAKNAVFAGWYAENEEGELEPFYNMYAEMQGKDGDYRTASQTWLCGTCDDYPTIPDVLIARFIDKSEDMIGDISIRSLDDGSTLEAGVAWDVYIDDLRNGVFVDPEGVTSSGISITVDSVSVPKLTVKGSVAGLTIKSYGSYAVLNYDPNGKTMPKPGEYTVTITAENQSKQAAVPRVLTIRVPNVVSDAEVIYPYYGVEGAFSNDLGVPYTVGESVDLDETAVFGEAPGGVERSLTVKNLPAGVSYKDGYFTGTPTKAGLFVVTVSVKYRNEGEKTWSTTEATVFFRVQALDPTVIGTFNGGTWDGEGASGTISATVSAAGKLTSCKLIDRNGKSTSVTLKTQTFVNEGDYYMIEGADAKGVAYRFDLYPAYAEEGSETLSGCLLAELNDNTQTADYVRQNVWGNKTYKTLGMLPSFPSKGVAIEYEEDDLNFVFKSTGDVTVTRGRKSGSARFELKTYGETDGWLGYMTVNVPDGGEGYCRTFEVAVSADSSEITVTPVE